MATINGLAIFVEKESVKRSIESTDHPTEKGLPLTSSVQKQPVQLSISGKIVNNGKYSASTIGSKIKDLQNAGSLITYVGRTTFKNLQIQSFDCDYSKDTWGGFEYSMELKEVRIATPSYKSPTKKKTTTTSTAVKKAVKKANPVLKVGAKVVFKGGNVYVSSDAKKAAAKRGRSTCKITIINSRSWAKHKYHLISTDGKKVYGWVDKSNIEGLPVTTTTSKSNGGTQQTKSGSSKAVYHTVKKGDTVYTLVNKNYKSLGKSVNWVITNNPKAFSKKGDPKTLKIGAKLLMGYKS